LFFTATLPACCGVVHLLDTFTWTEIQDIVFNQREPFFLVFTLSQIGLIPDESYRLHNQGIIGNLIVGL
jgi:hypothetical protein